MIAAAPVAAKKRKWRKRAPPCEFCFFCGIFERCAMAPADYQAAVDGAGFFDLSDHAIVEVAGSDARSFLHNLCTQDVKDLPVGATREGFLTTNKARVIAHVWITHRESNVLWLSMGAGQGDKVLKHLDHFLISEKVELADRSRKVSLLQLVGPKAAELLTRLSITPAWHHRLLNLDGYDLFCHAADVGSATLRLIEAGAIRAGSETHQVLRIEAGLPEYAIDIDENRLAMEVNRPQAISYNKGCYLGQETIVMARDRGQVNRLLMGVKAGSGAPLPHGTKLFRGNEEVGQVTSSTFSPKLGQVIALAYLRRGSWDAGTEVGIGTANGRVGVVSELPFKP
jgi:tRNA-modifying protein YgfZ